MKTAILCPPTASEKNLNMTENSNSFGAGQPGISQVVSRKQHHNAAD